MASSNPTASKMAVDDEALDPVLASIRKVEAIRDFASDITPLRSDGFNLHSWVGEIDKTLSDLIDRERYLRGGSSAPVLKSEDKIARNLIYWTIPRELRSLINDATTARDAYKALQAQFCRNTRTSHMAALVDLFNFQMDVTEPQHITMLYDQMYKGMTELVASGFVITEDCLLGALFQIAVGRASSQLYTATSNFLDAKFANDQQSITSHEVCAAARRQLEHWHSTIFDEGPVLASNEMLEPIEPQMEEEAHLIPSTNAPRSSLQSPQNVLPSTSAVNQQQQPVPTTNIVSEQQPAQPPTVPEPPQPHLEAGSSRTRVDPPVFTPIPSTESSTSVNQVATPSVPQTHNDSNSKATEQPSKPSHVDLFGKPPEPNLPKAAAAPSTGLFSGKPATTSSSTNALGSNKSNSSPFSFGSKADRRHG